MGVRKNERVAAYIFGVVFIITMLVLAIVLPNPTQFQYTVMRIVLALATAGVAAMIPGFIEVSISNWLRAGGALAVFVIAFFMNPAGLVTQRFEPSNILIQSLCADAKDWLVDTDSLLVSWLSEGKREDVKVYLENVRTAKRSKSLRVSSEEGRLIFEPQDYHSILETRNPRETNKVRAVVQTSDNVYVSKEFDLRVGITILLWGNAPDNVLVSALVDESSEAIPHYQFHANIVGWYKDRSRGPIIIAQKIQNPNTKVSFKGLSLELIDWGSLGVVYLGSDDDRIIRFSRMLNIPANENSNSGQ